MIDLIVIVVLGLAVLTPVFFVLWLRARAALRRFSSIVDLDAEKERLANTIQTLETNKGRLAEELEADQAKYKNAEAAALADLDNVRERVRRESEEVQQQLATMREELKPLEAEMDFVEHGLYAPLYDFDTSQRYAAKLEEIRERQKALIKDKEAVLFFAEWTIEGSRAKGKKMENEYSKLLLRAFNGECDALIMKVRYNNIQNIEKRISSLFDAVNKLGKTYKCEISYEFYKLKLDELHLVHEYQEKKQAEADEQRQIREQMREEERALREIERAIIDAEREESRYEKALEKARQEAEQATGAKHARLEGEIERLQTLLEEAHQNRERAKSRAEMTRSGYVYVISNIGSFGEDVFKIGMTRRLDPMDRVAELGDASVPFTFDVHAMIFSEDAPRLENALHRAFDDRRVNRINLRKEFFRVKLEEVQEVARKQKADVQFTLLAEAKDYRQSHAISSSGRAPATPLSA